MCQDTGKNGGLLRTLTLNLKVFQLGVYDFIIQSGKTQLNFITIFKINMYKSHDRVNMETNEWKVK